MAGPLRRGRGSRDGGAAAVELALVMPLLFTILMGIVNYGLYFNDSLSVRQGVREAARGAVVRRDYPSPCTGTGMAAVACDTRSQIKPGGVAYAKVFAPNGWVRGQQVVVCGMVVAASFSGFVPLPAGGLIKSKTVMSIEVNSSASMPTDTSYEDSPPTGESWSWCTA